MKNPLNNTNPITGLKEEIPEDTPTAETIRDILFVSGIEIILLVGVLALGYTAFMLLKGPN